MYDVFISYSRKDTKIVDRICKELDKNIAFYIAVVTQIAVIAAILVRCLYLFQAFTYY